MVWLVLMGFFIDYNKHMFYNYFNTSKYYILFVLLFSILIFLGGTNSKNFIYLYIMLIILTVVGMILDMNYSIVDETAHFDYINHIISQKKLPTVFDTLNISELNYLNNSKTPEYPQYEAVQGPIYYILMSLIAGVISNLTIRFLLIRTVGLCMLIVTVYFSLKTLDFIINLFIEEKHKELVNKM